MSSTLLDARKITRQFGARTVLDAVDMRVDAGNRIGLVGPNGSGKSTLLRILAGREAPDRGIVPRCGMVGYLPQLADAEDRQLTVRESVLDRVGLASASSALDQWAAALAAGDLEAVEPHAGALERWLALGGADVDARLGAAVADLGLETGFLHRPLGALSGGQAARAGLAALQVARFDVVLLDEPTNTSTRTGYSDLRHSSAHAPAAWCSSPTTERCSQKQSAGASSWTETPDRRRSVEPHRGEQERIHGRDVQPLRVVHDAQNRVLLRGGCK